MASMTVELASVLKTKKHSASFELQCVAVCCSVLQCVAVCCSEGDGALLLLQPIAFVVWSNLNLNLIGLFYRSLFTCRGFFHRSLLLRRIYSLLRLECHPISISNLNLIGLFSTGRDKKRPMRLRWAI